MTRINLLPWRAQLSAERQRQTLVALFGVLIIAVGVVLLAEHYLSVAVSQQKTRNNFLERELLVLDGRIKEVNTLKKQRQQLIERMQVIQDLQSSRATSVRIFDQLVRTLPNGVHFTAVQRKGPLIAIDGAAESNNRVSHLMRQQDESDWLTAPNLIEVKAVRADQLDKASTFKLTVLQTVLSKGDDL